MSDARSVAKKEKLSTAEKEAIIVSRVTTEDMLKFTDIRYDLNCRVRKSAPVDEFNRPTSHHYAYMELTLKNQRIARYDLDVLNKLIFDAGDRIPILPDDVYIDIDAIKFRQFSPLYGYTKLMCWPYTYKGNPYKYPLQLFYMSDLRKEGYRVSGTIDYGISGDILKATAGIWQRKCGWMYEFKTVSGQLVVYKVSSTLYTDDYGLPKVVYKHNS